MIPSARGRLFAAVLATIAFLAACSGGAATPAGAPAPTSTLISNPDIAALGALYLAAATALAERGKESDAAYTPEEIKVGYRNLATAFTDTMDVLGKVEFPAPVQADIDPLIGLYATSAGEWSKLADNPDYEAPLLTINAREQMTALDTRIRAALGLPPPSPPPP
jgi:hypothetical protein